MKYEEMKQLKNGCLLTCKGKNFMGEKVNKIFIYDEKCLSDKGYRIGSWLYPHSWFKLATKKEFKALCEKILKSAYDEIAKYQSAFYTK